MLRPTVSRPFCLVGKPQLGPKTRFLLLLDHCGFVDVERPLWRGDASVVYNYSWSSPEQSFSGLIPTGLMPKIRDSPNLEITSPYFYIPQEQSDPAIPPDTGFPFRRLLRLTGLRSRYWNPPPHGVYFWLSCVPILQIQLPRESTENNASHISSFVAWIPVAVAKWRGLQGKQGLMCCHRAVP
jgi:hypothetical protein